MSFNSMKILILITSIHLCGVEMRKLVGILLLFVAVALAPLAAAHGPGTYWVILRDTSIQPEEAELLQNDTILFMATGSDNLTMRTTDIQGRLIQCEMAKNDSCTTFLDHVNWSRGLYMFEFFDADKLRYTFNLTVLPDVHNGTMDNMTSTNQTTAETVGTDLPSDVGRSTPWPTMMAILVPGLAALMMGPKLRGDRWNGF